MAARLCSESPAVGARELTSGTTASSKAENITISSKRLDWVHRHPAIYEAAGTANLVMRLKATTPLQGHT
jgi:hypothetical protein